VTTSTLTSWALLIHRALAAHAIDGDALFRRAGLDPDRLRDPNARYPLAAMQRLWALATAAAGDECFGLEVAQAWHPTTFHALGYSALASETLREALLRVVRYGRVVTTGARLELQQSGDEVTIKLFSSLPGEQIVVPASIDAGVASILILCREGRGGKIDPVRVTLRRPAPDCSNRLESFFGCRLEFGATENGLVFRANDLDAQLPTANPVLQRVNEQVLTDYVARLERSEVTVQVQAKLIQLLPSGKADESSVARALNLSLRSMQRKLKARGVTFRKLLDDTRGQLAEQYLKDSTLSVSEIAYLLGFAEVSSFSRAFRRRTGRAPRTT
jgi:AraC-like DNA-binding protein